MKPMKKPHMKCCTRHTKTRNQLIIAALAWLFLAAFLSSCSNLNSSQTNQTAITGKTATNSTKTITDTAITDTKANATANATANAPKFDFEREYARELGSILVCNISNTEYYISNNFIYHEYATNSSKHNYRIMSFIGLYTREHNMSHWRLVPFINKRHSIYNDTLTWVKSRKMPNGDEIMCYSLNRTSKKAPYMFRRFIRSHIEPYIRFPMEDYWKNKAADNTASTGGRAEANENSKPEILSV